MEKQAVQKKSQKKKAQKRVGTNKKLPENLRNGLVAGAKEPVGVKTKKIEKFERTEKAGTTKKGEKGAKLEVTKKAEKVDRDEKAKATKKVASKVEPKAKPGVKPKGKPEVEPKTELKKKHTARTITIIVLLILVVVGGSVGAIYYNMTQSAERQTQYAEDVETKLKEYYDNYEQEIPKLQFEVDGLDEIENIAEKLRTSDYDELKQKVSERVARLRELASVRDKIAQYFQDGILKSDTTAEEVDAVREDFEAMSEKYQEVLRPKFDIFSQQYKAIAEVEAGVKKMFSDDKQETVRDDLEREEFNELKAKLEALPQKDVAERYTEVMKKADEVLTEREKIAEEARRKAEEEYRRQQERIAAAWHIINVPYWSQNGEGVKNGCEAASLLMGLQAKGYLSGMNLRTYAEMMPKSDDPFTGFRGKIFESTNGDAPFWIAPAPLAEFGHSSSGANVQDITGASLDALDAEVAAGNPVVIYLTLNYVAPSDWRYGAPKNLHVMLLTGYNEITGTQRVTDPYTQNGKTFYDLSRATVESIYNATGQRAVVIR